MKVITATEEVLNERGDIIKIIYHYEDETKTEKSVFIQKKREIVTGEQEHESRCVRYAAKP